MEYLLVKFLELDFNWFFEGFSEFDFNNLFNNLGKIFDGLFKA